MLVAQVGLAVRAALPFLVVAVKALLAATEMVALEARMVVAVVAQDMQLFVVLLSLQELVHPELCCLNIDRSKNEICVDLPQ